MILFRTEETEGLATREVSHNWRGPCIPEGGTGLRRGRALIETDI